VLSSGNTPAATTASVNAFSRLPTSADHRHPLPGKMTYRTSTGYSVGRGIAPRTGTAARFQSLYALDGTRPRPGTLTYMLFTEGGSGMTSFVLNHATWSGATTSLDDDATAATVQEAVDLVAGEGNVIVSGGPLGSAALTFEFTGANAGENVAAITATPTGGTGTLTVATSPAGASTTLATVGIALTSAEAEGDLIDVLVR